jgi:cyanate permease
LDATATQFRVYPYRWIVLAVFLLVLTANNAMWITFAPITGLAAQFFGVSDLSVGFLSMIFMITFIVFSIPASWVIDTYGLKVGVGIGALLTGLFGLTRGLFGDSYGLVLASQIGISIGQPFIANAVTTVASKWFPVNERATASGIGTLGMFFGQIVGLVITPYLALRYGIQEALVVYGVMGLACGALFVIFAKEKPATPPCLPAQQERSLALDGLKQMLVSRQFRRLMVIFFVGLGSFNAIATWIENILRPRGFDITQAGLIGGVMVICGIVGAVVIPLLSDRKMKRTPFIVGAMILSLPGLIGLTFLGNYALCLVAAGVYGFFLLGLGPLGFQYGAEMTRPAPEATSNGLLMMVGQISGILFILGLDAFKDPVTGSMAMPMAILVFLSIASLVVAMGLREPKLLAAAPEKSGGKPGLSPAPGPRSLPPSGRTGGARRPAGR